MAELYWLVFLLFLLNLELEALGQVILTEVFLGQVELLNPTREMEMKIVLMKTVMGLPKG